MQHVNNMGSLLQSYALKQMMKKNGAEVFFMEIKRIEKDYALLGDRRQLFKGENEKTGIKGKISKIDKYSLNRIKIRKACDKQDLLFERFKKGLLEIDKKEDFYDLCVIGSDEVFNCLNAGKWGFTSQLFGNIPEAKKVITYAASCGSTNYHDLPLEVRVKIKESFNNISAFSVRDNNTKKFVSKFTDKKTIYNFDPVFVYNFDQELEKTTIPKLPKHYCVVYSYYNRIHNKDEISSIKTFCKKNNLIPIAVGAPQFWIKDYAICTPFQCLNIFKNAIRTP